VYHVNARTMGRKFGFVPKVRWNWALFVDVFPPEIARNEAGKEVNAKMKISTIEVLVPAAGPTKGN
jgi:hypothetical protein